MGERVVGAVAAILNLYSLGASERQELVPKPATIDWACNPKAGSCRKPEAFVADQVKLPQSLAQLGREFLKRANERQDKAQRLLWSIV